MIDLTKPIWFYDDRSKDDSVLELQEILWQNEGFVLCRVVCRCLPTSDCADKTESFEQLSAAEKAFFDFSTWDSEPVDPILFKLDGGVVLNSDYDSWYATNDMSWWRPFGWINW